jgi:SET domain-containing protein
LPLFSTSLTLLNLGCLINCMLKRREKTLLRIESRYCCFRLVVRKSKIHGWGVYAGENIPPNRKVIEYTGERIGHLEAEKRTSSRYLFILDDTWVVDGGVGGSGAEFINHSCEPNLATRIMKGHILYMSLRAIRKGEELTVDYNYDDTDEIVRCACGARSCRGTINLR